VTSWKVSQVFSFLSLFLLPFFSLSFALELKERRNGGFGFWFSVFLPYYFLILEKNRTEYNINKGTTRGSEQGKEKEKKERAEKEKKLDLSLRFFSYSPSRNR
jgi:hypothetical protein